MVHFPSTLKKILTEAKCISQGRAAFYLSLTYTRQGYNPLLLKELRQQRSEDGCQ